MSDAVQEGRGRPIEPARSAPAREAKSPGGPADRAAALAAGAPGIPSNFVFWVLGAVLLLSLGGLLAEHLFSSAGLNPTPTTTSSSAARAPSVTPAAAAPAKSPVPTSDRSVSAPLAAFMGISATPPSVAPAFTLTDQAGLPTSLPTRPPRVVVLTFFDSSCNDICPVLASELAQADADLGQQASQVEFLTVNTDPSALAESAEAPVLRGTGLGGLSNWRMLTGPLSAMNAVWKAYGISISVDTKTGLEAHNDTMVFVDAKGQVRYRATPFADESSSGSYSSPADTTARWGLGIATYTRKLLGT